ncbi:MAG: single-stranded-DNA-specific exonuclease RecJ [Pseudomonadota bacterium]
MSFRKIKRRSNAVDERQLPEHLHPILKRVYAQRGISSMRQLELSLSRLLPAMQLSGMAAAMSLLEQALKRQQRILVVGDFDADGATSTALALRALRSMGAVNVHYLVPNRFEYGYGLTPEIVVASLAWRPDLIITVDNGVASIDGVAAAHAHGIKVMITDHHLPGTELPQADVIVNPNMHDDPFPSKALAGVGVIFYVMLSLRAHLRDVGWFGARGIPEPNMAQFLDLVALGTVADVVPLDHNNRIMVEQGLRRIRAGHCIAGIGALLRVAGRNQRRTVASDMGFAVGPRLNAAGRLQDMSIGIECLLTDDQDKANALAVKLDQLNRQRRAIESRMQNDALDLVEQTSAGLDDKVLPEGFCLYDEGWHQGVIGILASRIKERFHRPVIAFARAGNGEIKGSARSIPALHIRDLLDEIATTHPGLITKFGGHAMAAGLSLPQAHLDAFRQAYAQVVAQNLTEDQLNGEVYSDGELEHNQLCLEVAELLRQGGPWGQGFPEPEFDGVFEILDQRVVAEKHLKLMLKTDGYLPGIDAMVFNFPTVGRCDALKNIHIVYRLDVNEYRGVLSPQLVVTHLTDVV